jgi:hypothetical protein
VKTIPSGRRPPPCSGCGDRREPGLPDVVETRRAQACTAYIGPRFSPGLEGHERDDCHEEERRQVILGEREAVVEQGVELR